MPEGPQGRGALTRTSWRECSRRPSSGTGTGSDRSVAGSKKEELAPDTADEFDDLLVGWKNAEAPTKCAVKLAVSALAFMFPFLD